MNEKIIGYVMTRWDGSSWMFLGTKSEKVAAAIKNELDCDEGLSMDERSTLKIEPREFTQEEIDNMPEFPGW